MARGEGFRVLLHVLNGVMVVLALALASAAIWFFCQVYEFTSLRNSNHYLLDYKLYWPQAIPWIFLIVSVIVLCVTSCGFSGVKKSSRGLLTVYIICMSVVVLLLITAAVISLVFADNKSTDDFVKDTVWDVYFQAKTDNEVATSFGTIERKLHCCGADSPRDYKNWKAEFPMSCCDVYYHGFLDLTRPIMECEFTNKLANERYGCSTVAAQYARIAIKVMSAGAIFIAFIGLIAVAIAAGLYKALANKPPPMVVQYESESKKVLL
ncbi:23 kDa integral membrane protein [Papilio machaon]|uniref:23 kDa integral membrane protein n=1 Tax=Papilio machaon TaxID=76193 RepID=UPI001E6648DC|nr:23 kDa integral membrane protein [Papilio machaon]